VRPPAEQGQREPDRVALDVELVERLEQPLVEEPGRDDQRDAVRGQIDRLLRGHDDAEIVVALEGHPLLAARGPQRVLAAHGEPLALLEQLEAITEVAERLAAGERELERPRRAAHRRDLAIEPALERGHELAEQLHL